MRRTAPSHFAVLLRHFVAQFASFESLSPSGEAKNAVIAIVSLLAAPGYLAAVLAVRGRLRMALANTGRLPLEEWLWRQEWVLFTVSLSAVAVLVAVQWESFLLGSRDRRILGLLPVARGTVTLAKLAAVAVVVLLVHVGINALPGIVLPMASPLGYLRPAVALQLALLLQTLFVGAAIVAAHGALGLLLPRRIARPASSWLQSTVLLLAVVLLVCSAPISRFAYSVRAESHPVHLLLPIVWFRSLYLRLAGVESPLLAARALYGVVGSALGVAAAGLCCALGYRDGGEPAPAGPSGPRWPLPRLRRSLRAWTRPSPVVEAAAAFARRTVVAHDGAALITRGWLALGLAVTLSGLAALWHGHRDVSLVPWSPVYAPAIVLPFFALVGLRNAAAVPAALEANWVFRLTETPRSADYAAGIRSAAMRVAVWPLLALLAVPYVALWGPLRTLAYLALAAGLAALTVEWLFLGFSKIPFTCTYQPGKANLRVTWPKHAAVFLLYCWALPPLAQWLLSESARCLSAVVVLVVAREALARAGERSLMRDGRLIFVDDAPAAVTTLSLER
jgi:hypothetical protein